MMRFLRGAFRWRSPAPYRCTEVRERSVVFESIGVPKVTVEVRFAVGDVAPRFAPGEIYDELDVQQVIRRMT